MQTQIHLCSKEKILHPEKMNPIQNYNAKPKGGFWSSTYDETRVSDWAQWLMNEGYSKESKTFNGYLLTPKKDVRLYVVDSFEDCLTLLHDYTYINPAFEPLLESIGPKLEDNQLHCFYGVDYEKMQEAYDGFHLTRTGFEDCQEKVGVGNVSLFEGFDCESTVWFRWCFENIERIETVLSTSSVKS